MKKTIKVEELDLGMLEPVKIITHEAGQPDEIYKTQQTTLTEVEDQLKSLGKNKDKHKDKSKKDKKEPKKKGRGGDGRKPDKRGIPPVCPRCHKSNETMIKNGREADGTKKYKCRACKLNFTTRSPIYLEWKKKQAIIDRRRMTRLRNKELVN